LKPGSSPTKRPPPSRKQPTQEELLKKTEIKYKELISEIGKQIDKSKKDSNT
jgi:hypothetical protein